MKLPERHSPAAEPGRDREPAWSLVALLREGERLAAARPKCHRTHNELGALILIVKMHAAGIPVSLALAESCLERMRIAVETGEYPEALLRACTLPEGPAAMLPDQCSREMAEPGRGKPQASADHPDHRDQTALRRTRAAVERQARDHHSPESGNANGGEQ